MANFSKKLFDRGSALILILILLTLFPLSGCRVKYSFTGASISPDTKTVSIEYFPNYSTLVNPTLSSVFTEALKDKFITQTNLTLVKENGDLQFSGQITHYLTTPIAIQGNEVAARNRLSISIRVKYQNVKDSKFNFDKTITQFEDFSSERSPDERVLVKTIIDKIIDEIFNSSVANW